MVSARQVILQLFAIAVLLAAFSSGFSSRVDVHAQDSVNAAGMIQVSLEFVSEALPDIVPLIEDHNASVSKVNSMQVAEALSGLETYSVSWDIPGVELDVVVVNIEGGWEPISLDVILNGNDSQEVLKIISDKVMDLENNVKEVFTRMKNEALADGEVSLIGFQIYIDETPVAFLDPETPSVIPAMISWNSYQLGKIASFRLVNDYPILKYLMSEGSKHFKVSAGEALSKIESQAKYEVTPQVSKYLLITNGSVRPAYVSYVTPWKIAVVMADTGELLLAKETEETTGSVITSETPQDASGSAVSSNPYIPLMIAVIVILAAAWVLRSKLKRI